MNQLTKIALIVIAAGSISITAQAASVTIDLEEFSVGDGAGPSAINEPPRGTVLTSKGYDFYGQAEPPLSPEVITGTNTGNTNAYGGFVAGLGQDGFNYAVIVNMEKSDGGAFAIHDLDLFIDTDPDGWTQITGTLAGGGSADLGVAVGTGDWLNLESVRFFAQGNGFGFGYGEIELDNVVVSAVPIPAAVWLFGSALAGLGWLRKRPA